MRGAGLAQVIDQSARIFGALLITVFATLVVYVVASRHLFSSTPRWSEELPRLLLVWVTFIGAVSAFARGTHFRAGLLQLIVPQGPLRKAVLICASTCTAIYVIVLGWTGLGLTQRTWSHNTTALDLPVGIFYLVLPIACCFALLALAVDGWRK
ncbi:MAG: TRAP transporter small permease [Cognatishimia sp.]